MSIQYNRANIIVNGTTYNASGPGYVYGLAMSLDAGATWVDGMSVDYTAGALHGNLHPIVRISEFLSADDIPISWFSFDWATQNISFQIIPSISSVIGGDAYAGAQTMLILPSLYWASQSYAWDTNAAASRGDVFFVRQIPYWIGL